MYVTSTRNIISSYAVVFYESFSSVLAYTSQSYSESIVMSPDVTYTPCATSLRGETGDIIMFTQLEDSNILTKTRNDAESGEKSDDDSIIPPILSKDEMDAMDSGDRSDHDLVYIEILKDIRDGSKFHPNVNKREAQYKISDSISQRQS